VSDSTTATSARTMSLPRGHSSSKNRSGQEFNSPTRFSSVSYKKLDSKDSASNASKTKMSSEEKVLFDDENVEADDNTASDNDQGLSEELEDSGSSSADQVSVLLNVSLLSPTIRQKNARVFYPGNF
jgi:hypothetical protein